MRRPVVDALIDVVRLARPLRYNAIFDCIEDFNFIIHRTSVTAGNVRILTLLLHFLIFNCIFR
jgi:hypothetical protein